MALAVRKLFIPMNDLPEDDELRNGFIFDMATGEKIVEKTSDRIETDEGRDPEDQVSERTRNAGMHPHITPQPEQPDPGRQNAPIQPGVAPQPGTTSPYSVPDSGKFNNYGQIGRINEMDFVWGFFFFDMPSVFVDRNRIFFQGEIYKESVNEIKQAIINVGKDLTQRYYELGIYDPSKMSIELWITSPGGAVSAGFSLIDFMNNFHIPIHTVGTGTVASMAVLLLLAGKEKALTINSNLLVHQLRAGIGGRLDEILDYMKHLDELHTQMTNYIIKYTKLDAAKVKDLLARESWIMAPQALEMGFVDKIIGEVGL